MRRKREFNRALFGTTKNGGEGALDDQ